MDKLTVSLFLLVALASFTACQHTADSVFGEEFDSGYITVNKKFGANLFYYFIPSNNNPSSDPVVVWLQGGPGCSSLFGTFVENGPKLIQVNGSFVDNPWSWNTNASLLYIDQPVGTGYSYVKDPLGYQTSEPELGKELYKALQTFYTEIHPELIQNDLYIFGESYAGKYVPTIAYEVLKQNDQPGNPTLPLRGIGIGDGWTDPYIQTGSYSTFLRSRHLINQEEADVADALYEGFKLLVDARAYPLASAVGNAILEGLVLAAGDVDVYDVRVRGPDPTTKLGNLLSKYLNSKEVKKQFHANRTWNQCDALAGFALIDDEARSTLDLFPALLSNYRVLLYNGHDDLICNWIGTSEYITEALDWDGKSNFTQSRNQTWGPSDTAGWYRTGGNLTQLVVYGAGHMVPHNQPQNSHYMLYNFIHGNL